jgi:hypothetical protein
MGNALVISEPVHGQLLRLARHGLLPAPVLEAIENDDHETIREYINDSIAARAKRRRG